MHCLPPALAQSHIPSFKRIHLSAIPAPKDQHSRLASRCRCHRHVFMDGLRR
jgi:hypothetical protein